MPCAAASSSMPRMCAVLAIIGCSRRAAKVAIETWSSWLAQVGRLSTLAGCASDLFSQASAAAVTWAIMKPQFRPGSAVRNGGRRETPASISIAMRRSAIAPTSAMATAIASAASATGSAWKLPPETIAPSSPGPRRRRPAGCRSPHWPRAPAPARRGASGRGRRPPPAAGSAGSTGPARGRRRRGASGGSRCRRAGRGSTAATSICPGWPRSAWMRGSNGPSLPRAASTVSAPTTSAASSTGSKREQRVQRQRGRDLGAVDQRQAFLGREHQRRDAGAPAAPARPGTRSAVDQHLAFADQRQRQVRQRRQVARGADRALARDARARRPALCTASSASTTASRTPEWPRARLAALSASTRRTTAGGSGSPTPTAVRADQVQLQRREVVRRRCACWPACRSRC